MKTPINVTILESEACFQRFFFKLTPRPIIDCINLVEEKTAREHHKVIHGLTERIEQLERRIKALERER